MTIESRDILVFMSRVVCQISTLKYNIVFKY